MISHAMMIILITQCKTAVTPLLTHWSYCHLALSHRFDVTEMVATNNHRAYSGLAPSQWETSLQSNAVSHWLGAILESALNHYKIVAPSAFPWLQGQSSTCLKCRGELPPCVHWILNSILAPAFIYLLFQVRTEQQVGNRVLCCKHIEVLNKMANILQMTFSNTLYWLKLLYLI